MSELKAWVDKLNAMTPEEIRELMQAEEIKGTCGNPHRCAIAEFLTSKVEQNVIVTFDSIYIVWAEDGPYPIDYRLQRFIQQFDNGYYPELENPNVF